MKILSIVLIFLLGCNSSSPENNAGIDSNDIHQTLLDVRRAKNSKLISEAKIDSLPFEHLPYQPFKQLKGDTLYYLRRNFVSRKAHYQNKPLSILLKDIEIKIYGFTPIQPYYPPLEGLYGVSLSFEDDRDYYRKRKLKQIPNKLVILLKDSIDIGKIRPMLMRNNSRWTTEVKTFYEDKIVNDINTISISEVKRK